MSRLLGGVAVACARRPWHVAALWAVVGAIGVWQGLSLERKLVAGGFEVSGAPSGEVAQIVATEFRGRVGAVFIAVPAGRASEARTARAARVAARVDGVTGTQALTPGTRRRPGVVAVATSLARADEPGLVRRLRERLAPLGAQVGGEGAFWEDLIDVSLSDMRRVELITAPLLLVVLFLVFGSWVAAAVPLLVGIAGVSTGMLALTALSQVTDVPLYALNFGLLVGLGAGLDYALLMITRIRDELRAGAERIDAVRTAGEHAGHSVLVSLIAVSLALGGLGLLGISGFLGMTLGVIAIVVSVAAAALTLLPALAMLLGDRLVARRRTRRSRRPLLAPLLGHVTRRPWVATLVSVALLLALTVPLLGVSLAQAGLDDFPPGTESRAAGALVGQALGPGAASPILAVLDGGTPHRRFVRRAERLPGVVGADRVRGPRHTLLRIQVHGGPGGDRERRTLRGLDAIAPPGTVIGGPGAQRLEETDRYGERLPWVFGLILVLTMLIFVAAFRSVVIPIKAGLVNLLSVGATLGLTVWVCQDGHLAGPLGIDAQADGLLPFVPIFVFSTVYGLSMDYAVFLLSSIAEQRAAGKDARQAVVDGTLVSGRVITGAAAVMIAVAVPFMLTALPATQMTGFALLVGVLLDATIIRLVLVPALLTLLGERAWWWPGLRAAPRALRSPG